MKAPSLSLALMIGCASAVAFAQNFAVNWWTIGGGGGTSSGGAYTVTGTAGQSDAGRLTGGSFSLEGGFWGVIAALSPLLSIEHTATNSLVISWPGSLTGFVLQENADLNTTNWVNVATVPLTVGEQWQVLVPVPAGNRFYRLQK